MSAPSGVSPFSLLELVRQRLRKDGFYDTPAYWDAKSEAYEGLSRSMWPSQVYSAFSHARQMALLDALWPALEGLEVADVGCGTGRASLHMARRGARVCGLDFSPRSLEAAGAEAAAEGLTLELHEHDVHAPPAEALRARFDRVLSLGCLTIACREADELDAALGHLRALLRPGGQALFLEPIHRGRLLRRILAMSVDEWVTRAAAHGLTLRARAGIQFVPVRYLCAFRDLPRAVVAPLFRAGERLLEAAPLLEPLSDYKALLFEAAPRA